MIKKKKSKKHTVDAVFIVFHREGECKEDVGLA